MLVFFFFCVFPFLLCVMKSFPFSEWSAEKSKHYLLLFRTISIIDCDRSETCSSTCHSLFSIQIRRSEVEDRRNEIIGFSFNWIITLQIESNMVYIYIYIKCSYCSRFQKWPLEPFSHSLWYFYAALKLLLCTKNCNRIVW